MTDIKKTTKDKGLAKAKKLQLHKETVKDLSVPESQIKKVVGGDAPVCSKDMTGC